MDLYKLRIFRNGSFREDTDLFCRLASVMKESFIDPEPFLKKRLESCDTLYFRENARRDIVCFFLVGHSSIEVGGRTIPTVFFGPVVTSAESKGTGLVVSLGISAIKDAKEWEKELGQQIVLWGIAATPTAYHAAIIYLGDTYPRPNGMYSDDSLEIVRGIRSKVGHSMFEGDHPFLLRGFFSSHISYKSDEIQRIAELRSEHRLRLFDRVGFNESRGDGVIFLGRTPAALPSIAVEDLEKPLAIDSLVVQLLRSSRKRVP